MVRWLSIALCTLSLTACVGDPPPSGPLGDHPLGPVFLVHGSWPDNAYLWVDELQEALHAAGIESILVPHAIVVGLGTDAPAERIAAFHGELVTRHARTTCRAELNLAGVGYSSGSDVLLESCLKGTPYARCDFGGSPLALWNGDLSRAIKSGSLRHLVNYFSPFDGMMWVTFGAGIYGYHGAGWEQVDNRLHFWPHVMPLFNRGYMIERLVDEYRAGTRAGAPRHTCSEDPRYARWYRAARERLRTDWDWTRASPPTPVDEPTRN